MFNQDAVLQAAATLAAAQYTAMSEAPGMMGRRDLKEPPPTPVELLMNVLAEMAAMKLIPYDLLP